MRLSEEVIEEATGEKLFHKIDEIEILFQPLEAIDSLDKCVNLKKLCLINNELLEISNLNPVKTSLLYLCLCHQNIINIQNLDLPLLEVLNLDHNNITKIQNLNHCVRLKKLSLSNNLIKTVENLEDCRHLEQCLLHSNQISSLSGFEHNVELRKIGLAHNPVFKLSEIGSFNQLLELEELVFSDIHYGLCPITTNEEYTDQCILELPSLRRLDGVEISVGKRRATLIKYQQRQAIETLQDEYVFAIKSLNIKTASDEDRFSSDVDKPTNTMSSDKHTTVESRRQSEYARLHEVVQTKSAVHSRNINDIDIAERKKLQTKYDQLSDIMFTCNFNAVDQRIDDLSLQTVEALKKSIDIIQAKYDYASALLCLVERVHTVENHVQDILSKFSQSSSLLLSFTTLPQHCAIHVDLSNSLQTMTRSKGLDSGQCNFDSGITEILKLYQLQDKLYLRQQLYSDTGVKAIIYESESPSNDVSRMVNAYTVVPLDVLDCLLSLLTSGVKSRSEDVARVTDSLIFFSDADFANSAFLCDGNSCSENLSKYMRREKASEWEGSLTYEGANQENNGVSRPRLLAATRKLIQIHLCCHIDTDKLNCIQRQHRAQPTRNNVKTHLSASFNNHSNSNKFQSKDRVVLPLHVLQRRDLFQELMSCTRRPVMVDVELENPDFKYLYEKTSNNQMGSTTNLLRNKTTVNPKKIVNKKHQFTSEMIVLPMKYIVSMIDDGSFSIHYICVTLTPTELHGYINIQNTLEKTMAELSNENRNKELILALETNIQRRCTALADLNAASSGRINNEDHILMKASGSVNSLSGSINGGRSMSKAHLTSRILSEGKFSRKLRNITKDRVT